MDATEKKLEKARNSLLAELGNPKWLRGIGFGLVEKAPGIVLSVDPATVEKARQIIDGLSLSVPIRVRAMGAVRKRTVSGVGGEK
ncbi:MAG: hypothetical protein FD129_967 [bacterium]|nr:MAG: hypothetical protein FD129_967 [bacterium]